MNAGLPGFRGAPMTKGLLVASVSSSIVVQAASRAARRRIPYLVEAFTHAFVFRNPGELMVGTLLAYYFRLFERQMGTGNFGAYTFVTCGIAYAIQAALASFLNRPSAGGLYPLIFSNLVTFLLEVPPLHKFSFFGVTMSDKVFVYLAALQLLFSASQQSLAAGLSGMLAGMLYNLDFLGLRRFRLPRAVEGAFASVFGRALGSPSGRQVYVTPAAPQQQQQQQYGGSLPAPRPRRPPPEPSTEAVQQLVDMGFDAGRARHALQQANNNVELALQALL